MTVFRRAALVGAAVALLAACQGSNLPKQMKPVSYQLAAKMKQLDMKETSAIFIRIFKESSELEVWKETESGRYALLETYDICKWSGELGPKKQEGDRQAPEGFYTVRPAQMNPNSSYYLSFNIGYPNAYDRALERTGSNLMVHGACSSAGCYSMTDEAAGELFAMARDAFRGGQRAFQIQAFPFRMTPENLAKHTDDRNMPFWRMLKEGYDHFEVARVPPKVDVCEKRYVFNAEAGEAAFTPSATCPAYEVQPAIASAVAAKQAEDEQAVQVAVAKIGAERQQAAAKQQIAAASAEQAAARPSLLDRLLGRADAAPQPEATPIVTASTRGGASPSVSTTQVTALAPPVPRLRPDTAPVTARASVAVAQPAATPEPEEDKASIAQPIPKVGRFVKRTFNWFEDG